MKIVYCGKDIVFRCTYRISKMNENIDVIPVPFQVLPYLNVYYSETFSCIGFGWLWFNVKVCFYIYKKYKYVQE